MDDHFDGLDEVAMEGGDFSGVIGSCGHGQIEWAGTGSSSRETNRDSYGEEFAHNV
jgi:hypothetical protein